MEDSKHAYYLVSDVEIELADTSRSAAARRLAPVLAPNLQCASPKKALKLGELEAS